MRYAVGEEVFEGFTQGTKKLVTIAAGFEAVIALVLIAVPALAVSLLFAAPLGAVGGMLARIAGFSLLGLAFACWPDEKTANPNAVRGLACYNVLVAVLFVYLGMRHDFVGPLLWPAFIVHAIFTILLGRVVLAARA